MAGLVATERFHFQAGQQCQRRARTFGGHVAGLSAVEPNHFQSGAQRLRQIPFMEERARLLGGYVARLA